MSEIFSHAGSLISLNISNFNIEKVTDMSKMISWSQNLENLDITNFVINSGTNIEEFSDHCPDLKAVKCSQSCF